MVIQQKFYVFFRKTIFLLTLYDIFAVPLKHTKLIMKYLKLLMMAIASAIVACGTQTHDTTNDNQTQQVDVKKNSLLQQPSAESIADKQPTPIVFTNYTDSLRIGKSDNNATTMLSVDFPTQCPSPLKDSLDKWIDQQLCDTALWGEAPNKRVSNFVKKTVDNFQKESIENGSVEMKISKKYENNEIITMEINQYEYWGGAHGMSYTMGVSFCKENGVTFNYNMLKPDKMPEIKKLIKEDLKNYFEVSSDEELIDILFEEARITEGNTLTVKLPYCKPYINEDNMIFQYTEYEIAPYVYGQPTASIPLEKIKNYLTEQGKKFIKF